MKYLALVAAVACLAAASASATGCLSCLKSLLTSQSDYEKLANYLHEATYWNSLEANTKAAQELLRDKKLENTRQSYRDLVIVFAGLSDDDSREKLCSHGNLLMVRLMSEAMARGGNQGAQKVSEPVKRLNEILVKLIVKARSECYGELHDEYLTKSSSSVYKTTSPQVQVLSYLPDSYLFEGFTSERPPSKQELAKTFTEVVWHNQRGPMRDENQRLGVYEWVKEPLERELRVFVIVPCSRFHETKEANQILAPYADLLRAERVITPGSGLMDKFYENEAVRPKLEPIEHPKSLLEDVRSYLACSRVEETGWTALAEMILSNKPKNYRE